MGGSGGWKVLNQEFLTVGEWGGWGGSGDMYCERYLNN